MRAAVVLLALGTLLIAAAWNVGTIIDAYTAWLATDGARIGISTGWLLVGVVLLLAALVLLSRRAYRQLDRDFPNTFNDRSK